MKKAQIQSGETIIVIIILTIIIVFGLYFMSNYQSDGIEQTRRDEAELSSLAVASQLGNLPELRCTRRQTALERCIDIYKAKAFKEYLAKHENAAFKLQRFGNTNVTITIINPKLENEDDNKINIMTPNNEQTNSRLPIFIPIILNNPVTNTNHFAILEVTMFS
jgi:uncharacterized protein (UPF0333 family)